MEHEQENGNILNEEEITQKYKDEIEQQELNIYFIELNIQTKKAGKGGVILRHCHPESKCRQTISARALDRIIRMLPAIAGAAVVLLRGAIFRMEAKSDRGAV